ncbi:MAG: hypothetical protein ACK55G_02235, partial [Dolichospermum sp.]
IIFRAQLQRSKGAKENRFFRNGIINNNFKRCLLFDKRYKSGYEFCLFDWSVKNSIIIWHNKDNL